ncbi:hypothetical protein N9L07_04075, partial [Flavobacteriaceae bacterium]|nr:hypothetical protein [Flavobacteriaceae bacterium]
KPALNESGEIDYKSDFFGKETNLTVSGQLEAESYALGLGDVYTFGPTFRAENSNTTRHLAEFWMIEPEMAFYDLNDNMNLAEKFITSVLKKVLSRCEKDLHFLDERFDKEEKSKPQLERSPMGLLEKIKFVVENDFKRVSYTEAYEILRNSKPNKKKKFQFPITEWDIFLDLKHLKQLFFQLVILLFDHSLDFQLKFLQVEGQHLLLFFLIAFLLKLQNLQHIEGCQ